MESKSNEATPLRPQGERVLDAAKVEMDLNKFIQQIRQEKTWIEGSLNSITIFKSANLRLVLIGLHAKAELKEHQSNAKITVQVLQGTIEFKVKDQISILSKGQMIALHDNIPHSVFAQEESFFLLTVVK